MTASVAGSALQTVGPPPNGITWVKLMDATVALRGAGPHPTQPLRS
jgi:hypothetical protein